MIRYLKIAFLLALAVGLLIVAMANRSMVTLTLLPPTLAEYASFNWVISLPLYMVVFIGIALGLLIGFIWEWLREAKHRQTIVEREKQVKRLKNEVLRLRGERSESEYDVIAILDNSAVAKAS